jgi:hypothetical protein
MGGYYDLDLNDDIHFNVILLSSSKSPKWSPPFTFKMDLKGFLRWVVG